MPLGQPVLDTITTQPRSATKRNNNNNNHKNNKTTRQGQGDRHSCEKQFRNIQTGVF